MDIVRGAFPPGKALPSEHELMRRFGVSRGTVRQARASLRADGFISGGQGRRLYVNPPVMTQPLSELISFSAWARSMGRTPTGRVIERSVLKADAHVAKALLIDRGASVHRLVRLRLIDDLPVMIERTLFVESAGRHLDAIDLERDSIYRALSEREIEFATARHRVSAVNASRSDARHLGIARGSALLRVRRLGLGTDGLPLELAEDTYRADLVDFTIDNSASASAVVRRLEIGGA
jgi:GntR family transcriptional regulator